MTLNRVSQITVLGLVLLIGATPSRALTIHSTFDPTVTALGNAAQWTTAWNYAVSEFQSLYSDPITINITLRARTGSGGTSFPSSDIIEAPYNYAAMKAALAADAKTPYDAIAIAHLPLLDPTGGRTFVASFANLKALGILAPDNPDSDGTVSLGTDSVYTFDPNNRAVPGAHDFIGLAEHEISEVMGRFGVLGTFSSDDALDLFGYTAPGVLNLNHNQAGVYFSIDSGVTNLRNYNNGSNGGDDKDWASGQGADSFNWTGTIGARMDMSSLADRLSLDVIGYDLVPEPASVMLAAIALLGLVACGWRRPGT